MSGHICQVGTDTRRLQGASCLWESRQEAPRSSTEQGVPPACWQGPLGEEEERRVARRAQGSGWEAAQSHFLPIGLGYHSQVRRQPRMHEQVARGKSGLEPSLVLWGWGWVWEAKMAGIRE